MADLADPNQLFQHLWERMAEEYVRCMELARVIDERQSSIPLGVVRVDAAIQHAHLRGVKDGLAFVKAVMEDKRGKLSPSEEAVQWIAENLPERRAV